MLFGFAIQHSLNKYLPTTKKIFPRSFLKTRNETHFSFETILIANSAKKIDLCMSRACLKLGAAINYKLFNKFGMIIWYANNEDTCCVFFSLSLVGNIWHGFNSLLQKTTKNPQKSLANLLSWLWTTTKKVHYYTIFFLSGLIANIFFEKKNYIFTL